MFPIRPYLRPLVAFLVAGALLGQEAPSRPSKVDRADLPARQGPTALKGHDRADLRQDWNRYWFGGDATPEYLDAKNALAAQEAAKWSHLLPGRKSLPLAGAAVDPAWVNLGPRANLEDNFYDSDAGRPVDIVTHPTDPKIVYLATSGGGVFKSVDADLAASGDWTWTSITDTLPNSGSAGNVSVGALAMSPANADTLFLGLGDAFDAEGRGFYKSTNGGSTWTQSTGMGSATRTYEILPLAGGSIVLVGTNAGLKRSTDGGATFSAVSIGGVTTGQIWSVQAFSATELVCSRQASTTGTIWYSSDAGATWTQATTSGLTSPRRITLATSAASASNGWGVYENGTSGNFGVGILSTADKGHSWTFVLAPTASGSLFQGIGNQMSTDGSQGFYNHCISVDPTNVNRIFVGANLALYRTEDGGATWTQFTHWFGHRHVSTHADFHTAAWSKTGPSALYIGNDGGLSIVRNPAIASASVPTGASTVPKDPTFIDNRRNRGLATHLVYNLGSTIAASPADSKDRITIGLQDNGTRVRQNLGAGLAASATFEDMIGGDGFGTLIHPLDGNKMLGSLYYTRIFKSTNGGTSAFSSASTGITESNDSNNAPFAPKIALGRADTTGDTVYTFTNVKVYKSTNFATSWTAMPMTGFDTSRFLRNVNSSKTHADSVAAVTSGGRVWVTHNGGAAWTDSGDISAGIFNMSYVWFDTNSNQTLWAASVAPNAISSSHLWKSTNGGTTWTAADVGNGLPFGIPIHVIQNAPSSSSTLYAGTDFGVYRSTNGGASWARYGADLPMVAVRDLYIAPDDSFIRAGTFGRGVWEIRPSAVAVGPTIATHPSNQAAVAGQTATFSVVATGTAPFTYQWKKNTVPIGLNGTAASYTTPTLTTGDTGSTYSVTVTNSVSSVDSNVATLTVTAVPSAPGISAQPQNFNSGLVGGSATFSVTATGTGPFTYAWTKSGGAVGTNASTLTLSNLVLADNNAPIAVTVSNAGGSTPSSVATLKVRTLNLSGDSVTDVLDLAYFAKVYGTSDAAADLNGDGTVNDADLLILLAGI